VIGTLGTLVAAKRAGLLKSIRPELDALLRTAFFLSAQLYDELLQAAGEMDS
jgi:predicted nucleic acid-binding protein